MGFLKVDNNTNPIPATILTPKPFGFPSGGGGGGGGGGAAVVIAPHNAVSFQAATGQNAAPIPRGDLKVASLNMTLLGNRLLQGVGNVFCGKLRLAAGPASRAGFGAKMYTDPNPPGDSVAWVNYCYYEVLAAVTLDGAPPTPGNFLGAGILRAPVVNPCNDATDGSCDQVDQSISFQFLLNTTGLAGPHTVDLWIQNNCEWKMPFQVKTFPGGMPLPYDGHFDIHEAFWTVMAMEMDVVPA